MKNVNLILSLYQCFILVFIPRAYVSPPQRARRSTRPRARSFRPSSALAALGPARTSRASATPPPVPYTTTQVVHCAPPPAAPVHGRGRIGRERRERGRAAGDVAGVVSGFAVDELFLVVSVVAMDAARLVKLKNHGKTGRPSHGEPRGRLNRAGASGLTTHTDLWWKPGARAGARAQHRP